VDTARFSETSENHSSTTQCYHSGFKKFLRHWNLRDKRTFFDLKSEECTEIVIPNTDRWTCKGVYVPKLLNYFGFKFKFSGLKELLVSPDSKRQGHGNTSLRPPPPAPPRYNKDDSHVPTRAVRTSNITKYGLIGKCPSFKLEFIHSHMKRLQFNCCFMGLCMCMCVTYSLKQRRFLRNRAQFPVYMTSLSRLVFVTSDFVFVW
jgi:hypothetical protein